MVPKEHGLNQSETVSPLSPKSMDSTNQKLFPPDARASRDVFQARLPWQGMVKLHKGSIFVITETQGQDYKEKHKLDSKQMSNSPC